MKMNNLRGLSVIGNYKKNVVQYRDVMRTDTLLTSRCQRRKSMKVPVFIQYQMYNFAINGL